MASLNLKMLLYNKAQFQRLCVRCTTKEYLMCARETKASLMVKDRINTNTGCVSACMVHRARITLALVADGEFLSMS